MVIHVGLEYKTILALANLEIEQFVILNNKIIKYSKFIRSELRKIQESFTVSKLDKMLFKFKDRNIWWVFESIFGQRGINQINSLSSKDDYQKKITLRKLLNWCEKETSGI